MNSTQLVSGNCRTDHLYCLAFGCYPGRSVAALGPDLDYLATLADWPVDRRMGRTDHSLA